MVIFHSYVSLPEGKPPFSYGFSCVFPFSHGFPYGFPWMFIPPAMGTSVLLHGPRTPSYNCSGSQVQDHNIVLQQTDMYTINEYKYTYGYVCMFVHMYI